MTTKRRGTSGGTSQWGLDPAPPLPTARASARGGALSSRPRSARPSVRSMPPARPGFVHATLRAPGGEVEIELAPAHELARPVIASARVGRAVTGGWDERTTLPPEGHDANTTRTLGVGVLVDELVAVGTLAPEPFLPALLVTAPPARLGSLADEVRGARRSGDMVVGRARLVEGFARAMSGAPRGYTPTALVLRTAGEARARANDGRAPAWLTLDAALFLRQRGIDHLLSDLPSLDPPELEGEGEVARHAILRVFFGLPESAPRARAIARAAPRRTVTERVVVPDALDDGAYVVALGLPAMVADVVPSRPVLYRVLREVDLRG